MDYTSSRLVITFHILYSFSGPHSPSFSLFSQQQLVAATSRYEKYESTSPRNGRERIAVCREAFVESHSDEDVTLGVALGRATERRRTHTWYASGAFFPLWRPLTKASSPLDPCKTRRCLMFASGSEEKKFGTSVTTNCRTCRG